MKRPQVRGKQYKLSAGSRISANAFTPASKMSMQFRIMFNPILPFPKDKAMILSFVGAFYRWIRYRREYTPMSPNDLKYLQDFELSPGAGPCDRIHVPLQISSTQPNELVLSIPALTPDPQLVGPAYTSSVKWKIMAGCCSMKTLVAVDQYRTELTMPYDSTTLPAQEITIPLSMPQNSITLVAIALEYTVNKSGAPRVSQDKRWLPCGIVGGLVNWP